MMLNICVMFHKISGTVFNLQSQQEYIAEMAIFNTDSVQRATTPNVG